MMCLRQKNWHFAFFNLDDDGVNWWTIDRYFYKTLTLISFIREKSIQTLNPEFIQMDGSKKIWMDSQNFGWISKILDGSQKIWMDAKKFGWNFIYLDLSKETWMWNSSRQIYISPHCIWISSSNTRDWQIWNILQNKNFLNNYTDCLRSQRSTYRSKKYNQV